MGESVSTGAINALVQTFPGFQIEVNVIFDSPGNSEKISEEGREFLNQ